MVVWGRWTGTGQNANGFFMTPETGNIPAVVFKHYRALVKPEDVTAWSTRPEPALETSLK
jgi:hypothetical protein